jgi:hypothetical protein
VSRAYSFAFDISSRSRKFSHPIPPTFSFYLFLSFLTLVISSPKHLTTAGKFECLVTGGIVLTNAWTSDWSPTSRTFLFYLSHYVASLRCRYCLSSFANTTFLYFHCHASRLLCCRAATDGGQKRNLFPRSELVTSLYEQVLRQGFVIVRCRPDNIFPVSIDGGKQVRGTPGSGKSSLLDLLKSHVPKDFHVHRIRSWGSEERSRSYYFIATRNGS